MDISVYRYLKCLLNVFSFFLPLSITTWSWSDSFKLKAHIYHLPREPWTQHFRPHFLVTCATGDMDEHNEASPFQSPVVLPRDWQRSWLNCFDKSLSDIWIMKVTDSNVIRFHLQVLHGITVRSFEKKKERLFIGGAKIFGVPLENLPRRYIPEFGLVPWWVGRLWYRPGAQQLID